jgi:DMSO/TMAO reductase YedYZ molybdopterin-dependent catalytic subunit
MESTPAHWVERFCDEGTRAIPIRVKDVADLQNRNGANVMAPAVSAGLLLLVLAIGCTSQPTAATGPSPVAKLKPAEISEYRGERLTAVMSLPDNSISGFQTVDIARYRLEISGLVSAPKSYTYDQALARKQYQKYVVLHCVEGWDAKILWDGILVKDLLDEAGVAEKATVVIFHAVDGYTTSLPLQTILDREMLLAFKMNGVVLPPERGYPFQLVAEDKFGYKWAKWVTRIELSRDSEYRGYWEQRGYGNDAEIRKPQ